MKFTIEPDVIISNDQELLNRIWYGIKYPNEFVLMSDEQLDAWAVSDWIDNVTDDTGLVIKQGMTNWQQSAKNNLTNCCLINLHGQENTFKPDEAILFLSQPFQVFVENASTDGNFLNALINLFPKQSKQIVRFQNKLQFSILNGGGSSLLDSINVKINELEKISNTPSKFVRFFVLVDSDKKFPNETYKKSLTNLINYCLENSIQYHVLEKREVENYLTDNLVEKLKCGYNDSFIESFLELNEPQRDFFDLENGFDGKNVKTLDQNIQDLFPSEKINNNLRNNKWDRDKMGNTFKNFVSELWSDSELTKEMLLERCAHHSDNPDIHPHNKRELPDLLKKISDLL